MTACISTPTSTAEGSTTPWALTVANALHDAADHIPVMITLQLPAKAAVAPSVRAR